jgi:hypothetical protein
LEYLLSYKKQTNKNFHVDINFSSNIIVFCACSNSSTILYSEYIIYAILPWKVLAMKFLKVEQYNIQLSSKKCFYQSRKRAIKTFYFQQYKSDLKLHYVRRSHKINRNFFVGSCCSYVLPQSPHWIHWNHHVMACPRQKDYNYWWYIPSLSYIFLHRSIVTVKSLFSSKEII